MTCGACGHNASDHGDAVVHSACCADSCECAEYDNPRYVVTARLMFDTDSAAKQFMRAMDTHNFGDITRGILVEEI